MKNAHYALATQHTVHTIPSKVFGPIEVGEELVFKFPNGIPGLEKPNSFTFVEIDEYSPLVWMISKDGEYHFPVLALQELKNVSLDHESLEMYLPRIIKILESKPEANAYFILKLTAKLENFSLKAPIIVDSLAGRGEQLILDRFQVVEAFA